MNDSGSNKDRSYLQQTYERVKNTVFSPKIESSLRNNMAVVLPQRENTLDNVKRIANDCAVDIVFYVSKQRRRLPPHKYAKAMRRTVDEVLTKHQINFKSMVGRLNKEVFLKCQSSVDADLAVDLDSDGGSEDDVDGTIGSSDGADSGLEEDQRPGPVSPTPAHPFSRQVKEVLTDIACDLFADRVYNWGRIVTLYAFAGALAKHFLEEHKLELLDDIAQYVTDFVNERLAVWILEHGGWNAFDEFFYDKAAAVENRLWTGLLVATAVGVGALAAITVR